MGKDEISGQWFRPIVRIVLHVTFWILVFCLYYFTYKRLGGDYMWIFVLKELFVTSTLFYSGTWIVSKWAQNGKIIPILVFSIFSYLWWLNVTYLICAVLGNAVLEADGSMFRYVRFFIKDGYLGLYELNKFPSIFPDFLLLVSIPLAPKLTKVIIEESNKINYLEKKKMMLELEKTNLERENLSMELEILKSKISPHFLFNTLNSIFRLAEKGDQETSRTIMQLSSMLRYMLYQTNEEKIYLVKEIQFLKDYLNLIKIRFGESVRINVEISDIEEPYRIVPLILLPFIENAIKHGPERSRYNSWIEVKLKVADNVLSFVVANGVNRESVKPDIGGIGLENVKRRLDLRYIGRYKLSLNANDKSYIVVLEIEL